MDLLALIKALDKAQKIRQTPKGIEKILELLSAELENLKEFIDDLTEQRDALAEAVETLENAKEIEGREGREEREEAFELFDGAAFDVWDTLRTAVGLGDTTQTGDGT